MTTTVIKQPDAVEQKLVSMLDALQEGAIHIGNAAVKYAPDVADTVLMIVRINAISELIIGFGTLILGLITFHYTKKLYKYTKTLGKSTYENDLTGHWLVISSLIVATGIAGIASTNFLLNIWLWVAIFEPKLALAKQIVDSVLN